MVSAWLVITIIVVLAVIVLSQIILQYYLLHEDDAGLKRNLGFKILVIVTNTLAIASVMLLPLDVANARPPGGGLDMYIFWQVVYLILAAFGVIILPFAIFLYESEDDTFKAGLWNAIKMTTLFFIAFILILVLMYAFLNKAHIPVSSQTRAFSTISTSLSSCVEPNCVSSEDTLDISITFPIYLIALMSFIGWFLFVVYAGIGLSALPMDLINAYRKRPIRISTVEYNRRAAVIGQRATQLLEIGDLIIQERKSNIKKNRRGRKEDRQTYNKWTQEVTLLSDAHEDLIVSYQQKGGNPLIAFFQLIFGIIGSAISLIWVLHIGIFMLPDPPAHPFLNEFLTGLEIPGFPFFGVVAFAILSFYLLACVIKGSTKFATRFFFFIQIYPIRVHATLLNALMVNSLLILLTVIPTTQFCATAFPIYARFTSVDLIFGTQVRYMEFFRYFFDNGVFEIALLCIAGLALIYLLCFPEDKRALAEEQARKNYLTQRANAD